ncbi:hypothetical protein N665_0007s0036 [Sinapis alba]|nr:hypothetical protein N665_0007s0036 [Sinapis alba]
MEKAMAVTKPNSDCYDKLKKDIKVLKECVAGVMSENKRARRGELVCYDNELEEIDFIDIAEKISRLSLITQLHVDQPYSFHAYNIVPEDVTFWIPRQEERVETPPPGFFTCYQAHLMRFHIWFPIPVIVVKVLNRFNVSLGQITPCSLQHLIGIFVWSFECGKNLDAAYLEGLLTMRRRLGNLSYIFKPRDHMTIIQGFTSHEKHWREFLFYIRLDSASVAEVCLSVFKTEWSLKVTDPLALYPEDLRAVTDVVYAKRFSRVISRRRDPLAEEITRPVVDELGDLSGSICRLTSLLARRSTPKLPACTWGHLEEQAFLLRDEEDEADNSRLRSEFEYEKRERSARKVELEREHASQVHRAHREGKREAASIHQCHLDQIAADLMAMETARKDFGNFRKCRGAVGTVGTKIHTIDFREWRKVNIFDNP